MSRGIRYWAVALLVAGCSVAPQRPLPESPENAWRDHAARLQAIREWSLSGRLVIQSGDEAWHANLHWEQRLDGFEITVSAPLGGGSVLLSGRPGQVVLQTSDDGIYVAPDPEQLLREVLGWVVPVGGLSSWVLGLPQPASPFSQQLDAFGRLEALDQASWHVEYRRYRQVEEWELPDKIYLASGDLRVRIAVSEWGIRRGAAGS